MKKFFTCVIYIGLVASFLACSNKSAVKGSIKAPVYPKSISSNDIDSLINNREKNKLDESFIKALKDFTYTSTSKLLSGSVKNTSYSPTSLYMALSIAGTGAKNGTKDEIFSVLGTGGKDINYVSDQNSKLFRLLYTDNEIGKLKIANSVWLKKDMTFKKAFLHNSVNNFYASLFNVDFNDANTSKLMNKWISENTNGVLSPEINTDKEQIMSIINTIYYKNQWTDRFEKDKTKPDTFYISDGSKVQCDFMNNTFEIDGFTRGEGFTTSYLSLKNNDSMIFVLPDKGVTVESLLASPEKVASIFSDENVIYGKVIFSIPKFSFGNSLILKDILESMGLKNAFYENADFSGITDGTAFISNIKQQTHISINEEGLEAAAFTQIDYVGSAPPKDEVAEMILNRPFIYAIKSNDEFLFIGVVNNPTDK